METMRDIKIRLKSIDSTRQITQSMRLISNRKVQKMKRRMEENRQYLEESVRIVDGILSGPRFDLKNHVYINPGARRIPEGLPGSGGAVVIIITGDRGLCGGYNANAERKAAELMKGLDESGKPVRLIAVGSKGGDYFRRRQRNIIKAYKGLSENPFHEDAYNICKIVADMYIKGETSEVYLVYTQYNSMLTQTPKTLKLLPIEPGVIREKLEEIKAKPKKSEKSDGNGDGGSPGEKIRAMSYDPAESVFFEYAAASYISSALFGAMLESATCEQCARLTGMDSAVKNSEKIIDSLTLQYNQMRQGAITQEIAEIVGGANAVSE
ncbi:MAG: ATP synthase F1 subunit gamma [Oscillospiraceae bacterium]|nr:ATP synthase F1 subunit gamma [Oscillospiraceae bacterium]